MKQQKNGETAPAVSHEASLTAQRQGDTREKVSSSVTAQSTPEREVHDRMFISYSRKQFYFAESLMDELHKRGVGTWFDVRALAPGTSWQQALREGLDTCQGLVLIASRAAINSAYVRAEWQAALASNKPIYVILFEAVQLPLELQKASILDFRNDFDAKVALLASLIDKGIVHRDQLPRVHLRPHLPSDFRCRWVMGVLWSQVLAFAMLTILLIQRITHVSLARPAALPAAMMFGITWLVLAGYACYFAFGFTYRRRIAYTALSIWFPAFTCFILLVWFGLYTKEYLKTFAAPFGISLVLVPANAPSGGFPLAQVLFIFFFIICSSSLSWQAFMATLASKAVLRWLATGIAAKKLRNPWGSQIWSQMYRGGSSDGAVKTYRLYYVPLDEQLASEVQVVLGTVPRLKPSSDEQADVHIAVLTNQTSQEWLDQLVHAHPNLICIVATSIRLPPDERLVRQLQWVDYRSGSSVPLERLAFFLGKGEVVAGALLLPVVPESLEQLVVPWRVKVMSHMLMILAMFNLEVGGATAITVVRQEIGPLGTWPIVSVLIAGVLFWLADRLMNRSIPYYILLTTVIVTLVSMPLLGTLQALFQMFQGFGPLEIIGIPLGVGLLMSPLLLLWGVHQNLRRWLPKEGRWQSAICFHVELAEALSRNVPVA